MNIFTHKMAVKATTKMAKRISSTKSTATMTTTTTTTATSATERGTIRNTKSAVVVATKGRRTNTTTAKATTTSVAARMNCPILFVISFSCLLHLGLFLTSAEAAISTRGSATRPMATSPAVGSLPRFLSRGHTY